MTIAVTDLLTLDPNQVEQFRAMITALVQAYNPLVNIQRGPVQDLVISIKAALDAATQTNIDLIRQSSSMLSILANPALADVDTVNRLLSNYGLTRKAGAVATGTATIVISSLVPTVITNSTIITINGQPFQPTQTFAGRTNSQSVVTSSDVLITAHGSNYSFNITVQAVNQGSAGNANIGSIATLSQNPANFVSASAASTFTGGIDQETNQALITRFQSGLATKVWSNRMSIDALIRAQFPNLVTDSIIGFGDVEMLRDQHSLWPGSQGGRSDIYLRTANSWVAVNLPVTAKLIVAGSAGTWQFSLTRDQAPGFYEVYGIYLPSQSLSAAGFFPSNDMRGTDISIDATHTYQPDIVSALESTFSRYQTATIQFVDTVTNASSLTPGTSTASYIAVLKVMPQIDAINDYLAQRTVRPPMGDVLAKAVIPCFTTVSLTINVPIGVTVNIPNMQASIANAVNTMGFTGELSASLISQTVHNAIPSTISVTGVTLNGRIRRPDLGTVLLTDPAGGITNGYIAVTSDPTNMTTSRTVAFLLNAADVTINVVNLTIPSI